MMAASGVRADEGSAPRAEGAAVVLGAASCASSGCHGGADERGRQHVVWSQRDPHARAYATLTTARSARMAEALRIDDPAADARCTACHAPAANVPAVLRGADARADEGVSCASCHGPDTGWLRAHTRPDYTHADRVAAGLRDLRDLRARAEACVACHQNIDPELVNTGRHPRLIFELDGQAAAQPKHWREADGWNGAQAWLAGQAVALREISWALLHGRAAAPAETPRWAGLLWVLQRSGGDSPAFAELGRLDAAPGPAAFASAMESADRLAASAAGSFDPAQVPVLLRNLASTHAEFAEPAVDRTLQACRAERLVLALDRLLAALPADRRPAAAGDRLNALFALAQSIPDFAPADFAKELAAFEKTLP